MSNNKKQDKDNPNNKQPPDSDKEDKSLIPIANEEEEEEEYDPEEVYEDDDDEEDGDNEEEEFNIDDLGPEQKKTLDKRNKRILFLKALSIHPYQDVTKLAKKCGLSGGRHEAEQVIGLMLGMIGETEKDIDFPERVLKYFNSLVPEGYPNKVKLEPGDINELINLFDVIEEKLANTAKIIDPDKIFGDGDIMDAKTIKESKPTKKNIVMMDNSTTSPQSQQQERTQRYSSTSSTQQQPSQIPVDNGQIFPAPDLQSIEHYAGKYASPDIGFMEMALRRIPNPRPNSVAAFITSFQDLYTDWMANPMKMVEELKFFFGPTHGEHAYRLWKDYREYYMKKQGYSPLPGSVTGGFSGEYSPYNFGGYGGPNPAAAAAGAMQPLVASQDMMVQRDMDRRMQQLTNIIQLRMMEKAMEAQTPTPIAGQNYEEILDQNGKVIKRVFLANGHSAGAGSVGGGAAEMTLVQTLSTIFQETLRGLNNEKVELMKKISTPDTTWQDLAKTMVSNHLNQQNPIEVAKNYMEVANMFNQQNQNRGNELNKSIEALKVEVDSKIALQELDMKKMEMQHNWRMDESQVKEQENNVDKWLNVMLQMGEGIIKPVAMKFVEGLGAGTRVQNPFIAGFGQQQQQQQVPPQYQQQQAMAQQRYYQQQQPSEPDMSMQYGRQFNQPPPQHQQQQRIPPMQPLGPHPSQQQQQQSSAMNRPIGQVTEQEIQNELTQLTPDQVQELEDKMALDDINREKVRNAIRAWKNARRFNRPKPSPQQEEAMNILGSRKPVVDEDDEDFDLEDELSEQDFEEDEEEEEERFVPVARGTKEAPKPPGQLKKFQDFAPESTTEILEKKKLTPQQKAMLSEGQLSPQELMDAPDRDEDEEMDDYDTGGVPLPSGIRNASEDAMVQENLARTRQTPPPVSKKKSYPRKKKQEEQQQPPKQDVVKEAEGAIDAAEIIPSDDEFGDV